MTYKNPDIWPFRHWLKIAVLRFGFSTQAFWAMSMCDWLTLMAGENTPAMGRDSFEALSARYPD